MEHDRRKSVFGQIFFAFLSAKQEGESDMAKRILNMTAEEMTHATKSELIEAIAGSEGRVLASETIGITIPLLTDVTNAEFAASMGSRPDPSEHV